MSDERARGINEAHETDRAMLTTLSSIGINPKEVKFRGGGAKGFEKRNHIETGMYLSSLTDPNVQKHNDLLAAHADHLAERGLQLVTKTFGCGHTKVSHVQRNVYGGGNERSHYNHPDIQCSSCTTSV